MPARMQPALWGGLFIGVLSSLPFVKGVNVCCCLWVLCGGVLTSYLLQERTTAPITAADGALAGLTAGAIGAVICAVLSLMFDVLRGFTPDRMIDDVLQNAGSDMPEVAAWLDRLHDVPSAVWYIVSLMIGLIVFPIFGTLGGLLGAAIFKKSAPPPPPPGTMDVLPPA